MNRSLTLFIVLLFAPQLFAATTNPLQFTSPSFASPNPVRAGVPFTVTAAAESTSAVTYSIQILSIGVMGNQLVATPVSTDNPATFVAPTQGGYEIYITAKDAENHVAYDFFQVIVTSPTPSPLPELDTDGDGEPDEMETALGTDPNNPASNSYVNATPGRFLALNMNSFLLTFDSKKQPGNIIFNMNIICPNPNVNLDGKKFVMYMGGIMRTFSLTQRGRSIRVKSDSGTKGEVIRISISRGKIVPFYFHITGKLIFPNLTQQLTAAQYDLTQQILPISLYVLLDTNLTGDQLFLLISSLGATAAGIPGRS